MEITPISTPTALELLPVLDAEYLASDSLVANDPGRWTHGTNWSEDLNSLIAEVTSDISEHVEASSVAIELELSEHLPEVSIPASTIAFVVGGLLVAQLRSLEEGEEGVVRVRTLVEDRAVKISILLNGVPALSSIRAIEDINEGDQSCDPTIVHCRRMIEDAGGSICLDDDGGFLGFRLNLPSILRCNPYGLPVPEIDDEITDSDRMSETNIPIAS